MTKVRTTPNTMVVAGQPAIISYVPEIGMFRGKFIGLSGYCDFVADSIDGLKNEGEISLREYLQDCQQNGIAPYEQEEKVKTFTLRYPESFGERLAIAAAERQVSVNSFIVETLNERIKGV
ncbi:type II toxin-antitoxin system HicB family antitoxin [Brenneria tiliae]|uniref:Type II toxin-antitoxin system HicB family antitoxin n=1 Tax=Brenneria tiliae TaxID=2914984 RepID=A0ABT0MUR4_9GAMM|nr:type II toxin-antitoxin system HicB family antitoxin [Brenneria tiliae]MCL2893570.1 type II toxin-antitoxin system HicB family antitoxin [Brenneria tiliae]